VATFLIGSGNRSFTGMNRKR